MKNIHLFLAVLCLTLSACCAPQTGDMPINKKEIMDRFVAGTLPEGYAPAAFFVHFGAGQKTGDAAVNAHLQYFVNSNMDILKVQFEQSMPRLRGLNTQAGWDSIAPVPEDFYRPTLEVIKKLYDIAGQDVYILPTIYSPYQVARQSVTEANIVKAAVERPNDLLRVLGYYADALSWLVKECKAIGIEGFYMTTQGGEMKFYNIPDFFETFIKPFDLRIMGECASGTKMNILHICDWEGTFDDLTRFKDYPGQIVNTPINLNGTPFTLTDGYNLFKRPVLGGMDRHKEIIKGSTDEVAAVVKQALAEGPEGKVMIGAECTVSSAPSANIQTAVRTAHRH